jgi:phenylalanyl-tRNA synthetase beta chain
VDIAEDIGIAYGYNNIPKRIPATNTVGSECRINLVGDLLRDEIAQAGYTEILTHGLCSLHDNFTALQRPILTNTVVQLSNPANVEYEVVRTSLLPGLLKTLQNNKKASFSNGFKVFEISDIVLVDTEQVICETIVGTRNVRAVAAVYAGPTSGFEIIHGLVDRIFTLLEIAPEPSYMASSTQKSAIDENQFRVSREGWFYTIREETQEPILPDNENTTNNVDRMYFPGRAASIWVTRPGNDRAVSSSSSQKIGSFGILHPQVLKNFDILYPASCVEIDLEALL